MLLQDATSTIGENGLLSLTTIDTLEECIRQLRLHLEVINSRRDRLTREECVEVDGILKIASPCVPQ
jgi:hypothetical protein